MWKLVIEDDEGKRTVVPLTRDEYTVGRKEGNSIRLTERNVSRDHAKVSRRPGPTKERPIFTLGDLTSYNGVYVNGLRVVDRQDLSHGDLIQIGDYRIVLQDELADATELDDGAVSIDSDDLKETVSNAPVIPIALRATNATFLEKPNRLVVLAGPNPGEEFPLVGERLTIGRAEDATISVNHNSVSRLHCEVHALGDARFEIVDKGSSNGVRVNGADLRRGIIEAGDIIELGDVKFKFVGEGQLFRPGNESQQLAAISPRSAANEVSSSGRSPVVPIVVAVLLALAAGGAIFLMRGTKPAPEAPAPQPVASTPPPDNTGADIAMLADARRMSDIGDVEGAHQKANTLPPPSALHTSADFMYIELKWASMLMFQADAETDPATKASILQRVTNDPYVDATVKKTAAARLAAVDLSPKDAGKKGAKGGAAPVAAPNGTHGTVQSGGEVAPAPAPAPAPKAATPSLNDLAISSNPADVQKARDILESKVFAHRGSASEIRLLKAICRDQHDQQCVTQCVAELNR